MKKYVIDANVLFSAIIGTRRVHLELIKNVELYAPDYILKEIEKYELLLLKKTKLTKKELNDFPDFDTLGAQRPIKPQFLIFLGHYTF